MSAHMNPAKLAVLALLPAMLFMQPRGPRDPHQDVLNTIDEFKKYDPGIQQFFDNALGYAVFPTVGKGAVGVGGAHGTGELVEKGKGATGKATLNQLTVGLQAGGQAYSEIIFFETQASLDGFKKGDFALAAQATGVVISSGASASANAAYRNGVAVFTLAKGGLMYEASIGGQKFEFGKY